MTTSKPYSHSGEKGNKMSDEELEHALMDLFCKTEQFALEFLGAKTSKEDFANNNAVGRTLDHQQAAHIAMQLIKQHREAYALEENKNGFFAACGVCGVENTEKAEEYYRMYRAELREKVGRDHTK